MVFSVFFPWAQHLMVHPCSRGFQYFILSQSLRNSPRFGMPHVLYMFINWWMFGSFLIWGYWEWHCDERFYYGLLCRHLFSILLDTYLGGGLMGCRTTLCLAFEVRVTLFIKLVSPFYILRGSGLLLIFVICLFFFSYLSDFRVALLCDFDSLMVNYVKHLFVCLLATYIPFWKKWL